MMNYSMQSAPMTPNANNRLRRILPPTPRSTVSKSRRVKTPHRHPRSCSKGTLSSSHREFHCRTPSSLLTGDRFIPNRAQTDVSKARRALLQRGDSDAGGGLEKSESDRQYECHLSRTLFGADETTMTNEMATTTINNNSIMSFGRTKVQRRLPFPVDRDDPYDQDILRPKPPSHALIGQTTSPRKRHRENVSIIPIRALDAPDILLDDSITLVDTRRGAMAVALHDEVYLWQNETVTLLATIADAPYTCVRWSTSGDHIALGQEEFVQIYSKIKRPDNGSVCFVRSRELYHHSGFVTAIVWKGMEIVAAGDDGLKRCNVKEQTPPHTTYRGHNGDGIRIVGLEWQNNTIASAGSDDKINLFDASKVGNDIAPRCTMVHPGVRTLAFSPHQPNLLVSGGEGGVQFWNVLNGSLRASLKTEEPVVGVLFPKSRDNMILVAHGDKLSLWNFSPKMTKIGEAVGSPNARILSLAKGPNGRVVCTNSDERIILFSLRQEPGRNKKMKIMESDFGTLKMPVIR